MSALGPSPATPIQPRDPAADRERSMTEGTVEMAVQVTGLGKRFRTREGGEVTALHGVTGSVRRGEFISLVGPSGCGKSTLLNIVGGLIEHDEGEFQLQPGKPGSRAGMVFQSPVLLPWRTALQNVLVPAEVGRSRGQEKAKSLRPRAQHLLDVVGLGEFSNKYPDELSGGMQQRVAIARGLLLDSHLLLMDEPFSALDEFTREHMNLMLLDLWAQSNVTIIFVTHNIFEAVFLSDRIWVMAPRPGRIVADLEVKLERPRRAEMIAGEDFSAAVRNVRAALTEHWQGE
jgi:NitT/TauT family transport system ATP-binding protein